MLPEKSCRCQLATHLLPGRGPVYRCTSLFRKEKKGSVFLLSWKGSWGATRTNPYKIEFVAKKERSSLHTNFATLNRLTDQPTWGSKRRCCASIVRPLIYSRIRPIRWSPVSIQGGTTRSGSCNHISCMVQHVQHVHQQYPSTEAGDFSCCDQQVFDAMLTYGCNHTIHFKLTCFGALTCLRKLPTEAHLCLCLAVAPRRRL